MGTHKFQKDESCFVHWVDGYYMHPLNTRFSDGTGMGLLRACRQLYNECIEIAYQNPIFGIMDAFQPPVDCAMPFLARLGSQALQNLRYLSLNVEELDYGELSVDTVGEELDFIESQTTALDQWLSQSKLSCLFLAIQYSVRVMGYEAFLVSGPRWKWACSIIERNQSTKFIGEIHVDVRVTEPPSQDFVGSMTSCIKSWHDLPPIPQYEHLRSEGMGLGYSTTSKWLTGLLLGTKESESNDATNAIINTVGYKPFEILYKDSRESPNSALTHLSVSMATINHSKGSFDFSELSGQEWNSDFSDGST